MPEVGSKAPDFELAGDSGKTIKLSDLAGKNVATGLVRIEQTNLDPTTARNEPQGAVAMCSSARRPPNAGGMPLWRPWDPA